MDYQVALTANARKACPFIASAHVAFTSWHDKLKGLQLYRAEIAKKLDIGRVVFLIVVLIDFAGLALAMIMRGMSDHAYR